MMPPPCALTGLPSVSMKAMPAARVPVKTPTGPDPVEPVDPAELAAPPEPIVKMVPPRPPDPPAALEPAAAPPELEGVLLPAVPPEPDVPPELTLPLDPPGPVVLPPSPAVLPPPPVAPPLPVLPPNPAVLPAAPVVPASAATPPSPPPIPALPSLPDRPPACSVLNRPHSATSRRFRRYQGWFPRRLSKKCLNGCLPTSNPERARQVPSPDIELSSSSSFSALRGILELGAGKCNCRNECY